MIRRGLLLATLLLLASPRASAEPAKRLTLPNGLPVIVKPTWATEIVAVELLLGVSCLDEPRQKSGIRYLVQRMLLQGTQRQSGSAMARQLAAVGGVIDTSVGLDYVEIYALVPAEGFEAALTLLADAARNPAFLPDDVQAQGTAVQKAAKAARDDPFQQTYLAFRDALYGDHPYAGATFGEQHSLAALTREDLTAFHARHYRPNNAALAICGGVGEARVMRAARQAFGDWLPGPHFPVREAEVHPLSASVLAARELPIRRAHLILGFSAPSVAELDYYAVQVIDSLLSGGASSRLPQHLREDLGLVYDVSSFYPTLSQKSHLAIYAVTAPQHLAAVKSGILQVLTNLMEQPVAPHELTRAKRYLLGSYAISHQRMKHQAYSLAWYETLGLGCDFADRYAAGIEAVTPADVQRTARLILNRFVFAVTVPRV